MSRPAGSTEPVRSIVETCIADGRMPGASWWSGTRGGAVSRGAAGRAVVEPASEPATLLTPFDLASLTKPLVTAILAVIQDAEGTLALGAPAVRWLPELRSGAYGALTLEDLGAHRGGLPGWRPLYLHATDRDSFVQRIAAEPPAGPPDATLYSDLSYILLGIAIERAAGVPLDRLFQDRIARPLSLGRAGFAGTRASFADAAATERGNAYERHMAGPEGEPHAWRRHVLRGEVHDGNAWALGGVAGHAGLFATAEDVAAMAWAVLEPARLGLDPTVRDLWLRPAFGEVGRTFGWLPAPQSESVRDVLEPEAVGHFGFTGTSVWIEPLRGAVHVLLTNRVHPDVPTEPFVPVRRAFHEAVTTRR